MLEHLFLQQEEAHDFEESQPVNSRILVKSCDHSTEHKYFRIEFKLGAEGTARDFHGVLNVVLHVAVAFNDGAEVETFE